MWFEFKPHEFPILFNWTRYLKPFIPLVTLVIVKVFVVAFEYGALLDTSAQVVPLVDNCHAITIINYWNICIFQFAGCCEIGRGVNTIGLQ
jgi:hypothetical protein